MANNDKAVEISEKDFEKTINSKDKQAVVVDFYAEWCLDPETELVFNPCIREIKKAGIGSKILSFDENFNESFVNVASSHKIISNKRVIISTERGREVISTPEHLLLTRDGFLSSDKLSQGDFVATYLFSDCPKIKENNQIFLTGKKVLGTAKELNLNKEKYISELKNRDLLEIRYDDEKAHILASLLGLLLSDGSLSMQKNNLRSTEFFVNEKDVEEVIKDLKFIGYDGAVRSQEIEGLINKRKFMQKISRVRVSKTSLFILFASLGGIVGRKFINGLKIPEWILEGPKELQKSFLQGFFGGDGPKIEIRAIESNKRKFYNKTCINPIEFHFYSKSKNSPKKFSEDLSIMLKNLGTKTRNIKIEKEKRYKRRDEKESLLLKIYLNTDLKSAYNYSSIGFKYAYTKKLVSALAREYLRERINLWKEAKKSKDPNKIRNVIRYQDWVKKYVKDKIVYDKINKIKAEEGGQFPFISISLDNKTKMFVANDIIHHNCMPCLMIAPVIEELASKIKAIKFARINVDENKALSSKFNITSIPCLIVFKDGKEVERITGALPEEVLEEKLKKHLK